MLTVKCPAPTGLLGAYADTKKLNPDFCALKNGILITILQ